MRSFSSTRHGLHAVIDVLDGTRDLVLKGVAGDASVPEQLAKHRGTDLTVILMKQSPIAMAVSAVHC